MVILDSLDFFASYKKSVGNKNSKGEI